MKISLIEWSAVWCIQNERRRSRSL